MKIALVTTTIHVPEVLRLYRAYGPGVQMFVAADDKTPNEAYDFCRSLPNPALCLPIHPDDADETWRCSKLIGRNTIGRRSVAILEALKAGADVIVSIDDDNLAVDAEYFENFKRLFFDVKRGHRTSAGAEVREVVEFVGLQVGTPNSWLDYGRWLVPSATQRGIPQPSTGCLPSISFVTGAKIGVAQGICLGDPDTSAVDRISRLPMVHQISELLRSGVVVHPLARTVFNTQNVAFVRELAPCFLMVPQFGRHDDIYASLICRRVMRETGHYLHLGKPFCWQQRNDHDLLADLKNEMWGMQHVVEFAQFLDDLDLGFAPVLNMVRLIYGRMAKLSWMPAGVSDLGLAWCDDVESVL